MLTDQNRRLIRGGSLGPEILPGRLGPLAWKTTPTSKRAFGVHAQLGGEEGHTLAQTGPRRVDQPDAGSVLRPAFHLAGSPGGG